MWNFITLDELKITKSVYQIYGNMGCFMIN